jgi:hypothetical protein
MARKKKEKPGEIAAPGSEKRTAAKTTRAAAPEIAAELTSTRQDCLASNVSLQEKIALLAYTYWEERGRQGGSPEEDWYRAEREIFSRVEASKQ